MIYMICFTCKLSPVETELCYVEIIAILDILELHSGIYWSVTCFMVFVIVAFTDMMPDLLKCHVSLYSCVVNFMCSFPL